MKVEFAKDRHAVWYGEAQELSFVHVLFETTCLGSKWLFCTACYYWVRLHLGLRVFCKERQMVRGQLWRQREICVVWRTVKYWWYWEAWVLSSRAYIRWLQTIHRTEVEMSEWLIQACGEIVNWHWPYIRVHFKGFVVWQLELGRSSKVSKEISRLF